MTGIVVCSGSIKDYKYIRKYFDNVDMVICADGGARHLRELDIVPDILVGDFDSILPQDMAFFTDAGVEIIAYPAKKDFSDTQLAAALAVERRCTTIIIIGALGTRLDHSLANVFLLKWLLDKGVFGVIADDNNEAVLIDKSVAIKKEEGTKLSLIPFSGSAAGVTTKGLCYPLVDATLEMGTSLAISNEFIDDIAYISITGGLLLVVKSRD